MRLEIRKTFEGGYCSRVKPQWTIYLDGREIGFVSRLWLAADIVKAIDAGHILPEGDVPMRYGQWIAEKLEAARQYAGTSALADQVIAELERTQARIDPLLGME